MTFIYQLIINKKYLIKNKTILININYKFRVFKFC